MLGPADIRDWLDDAVEETSADSAAAPSARPGDRPTAAEARFPTLPRALFGMMAWTPGRRGPRS